jgi:uncharacterized tellurite resistance protein B-like protein
MMKLADLIYAKTGISLELTGLADDPDEQALVASLLALVARSDGTISAEESTRMVDLLRSRFHRGTQEAVNLVDRAINEFGADANLDGLVANINDELSLADKEDLIDVVLHIIAADNRKDAREMELLATLINGLHIPDNVMERAYAKYFQSQKAQD